MTTITINEKIGLPKTNFENLEELFKTLKEFAPFQLYQVDKDEFSPDVIERVDKSRKNPNKKLTNFQDYKEIPGAGIF